MNIEELKENGVPVSWVVVFLIVIAVTYGIGFVSGLGQKSDDYQRGLEAGFRMATGHPELRTQAAPASSNAAAGSKASK